MLGEPRADERPQVRRLLDEAPLGGTGDHKYILHKGDVSMVPLHCPDALAVLSLGGGPFGVPRCDREVGGGGSGEGGGAGAAPHGHSTGTAAMSVLYYISISIYLYKVQPQEVKGLYSTPHEAFDRHQTRHTSLHKQHGR
jgi:hypothetical protein